MAALEPELLRALRRRPAPAGLDERILSRLPRQLRPARWRPAWLLAAAAALLVGLLGVYVNEKRIERRNEQAREQLVQTLRLASREIAQAEGKAFSAVASARASERPSPDDPAERERAVPMHSPGPRPRT